MSASLAVEHCVEEEQPNQRMLGPIRHGHRMTSGTAACAVSVILLMVVSVVLIPSGIPPAAVATGPSVLSPGGAGYGTCARKPSDLTPLRWGSDMATADHICCRNKDYAEQWGYWESTTFPSQLPAGQTEMTFYETATNRPLFVAPRGRSWDAFLAESHHHGWPSFRDAEVVWANVRIQPGGETTSVNGTHLGHNLPDGSGNRYCIDIVCVAGKPSGGP